MTRENKTEEDVEMCLDLVPLAKLKADLKAATELMSDQQARYLVDIYYCLQENRKRAASQVLSMETEPHEIHSWIHACHKSMEAMVKSVLGHYALSRPVGRWSMAQHGIGPVISAGIMAHVDIAKAPHVGHVYSFAGIAAENKPWKKGEKRPWNPDLKNIIWKASKCFVYFSGSPECFYGKLYLSRKEHETKSNQEGKYEQQAVAIFDSGKYKKETEAKAWYSGQKSGKPCLPPGHLHARAMRWAVKIFLSHWHEAAFFTRFGVLPPMPYALTHLGHVDEIEPPKMDLIAGWQEAREERRLQWLKEKGGVA